MPTLVRPSEAHLAAYADALARGWSPDTTRAGAAGEQLARIRDDAAAFLATLEDDDPDDSDPVTLPDGSQGGVPAMARPLDMGRGVRRLDQPALASPGEAMPRHLGQIS